MTNQVNRSSWRRLWTALGGALKRGLLNKSSHAYMKRISPGDEYWHRALARARKTASE
jgi:hypothetical protein